MNSIGSQLFEDLCPEELDPRLELQLFVDPMGALTQAASNNCCRDGGNCALLGCDNNCRDAGNCNVEVAFQPLTRKIS
ncbi:MAG TPA: hypothetical protein VKM94_07115 [Blastocatellia bacterium]|nr:hypothetical protein [Blastocatellia bacterium]